MRSNPFLWVSLIILSACAPAVSTLPSTLTPNPSPFIESQTQSSPLPASPTGAQPGPGFTPMVTQVSPGTPILPGFCSDPQPVSAINSLKTSILTQDGALLASIVHPTHGMDVQYFRGGNAINYTAEQAKFLFETTFEANWGNEPGSGQPKKGAFHEVIVPDLVGLFGRAYTLHCNELKVGGATYTPEYPYGGDFYSVFYAGSEQYGQLDWNTWAVGISYSNGKPFISVLMHFFWEP